ncbi:MAG TPA: DEAD/DEAH box helicase [Gemmatimonadales bacterium]|nr:DEAD/DEAH box helicase [Gemmatimonadales bacterium]
MADGVPAFLPRSAGDPRGVAAALARAALPAEAADPAPEWLLPRQVRAYARALAAVRRFGGALLADAVGTGKTYIALAVAKALMGRATCIVPAALTGQWRATAARLGVPVALSSHERVSRGTLPRAEGLVIVDESHHYRNPGTRRYDHLARWIAGRRALLLSATPVINRLDDLSAQLLLVLPDDVLAPLGVPSLARLPDRHVIPSAIALVMLTGPADDARPGASVRSMQPEPGDHDLIPALAALTLSRSAAVARLVRGVLLRAAASSPAALDACLRRYRLLLLQGRDAAEAGVQPDRAALRRWAGDLPEQTVLWQLFESNGNAELALDDLTPLDALIRRADLAAEHPDAKAQRLAELVSDGSRTLVFTGSRDTALWLRRWIDPAPAWCTGEAAGIGHSRMPRESVLAGFAPADDRNAMRLPHVLIATEVAAEGLDLQRARRVIHYDLPWNPARLDQREGRARRLGSAHRVVDVVTFHPPPAIEQELRQLRILDTKRGLIVRARLAGEGLERLRTCLDRAAGCADQVRGIATVAVSGDGGALAGLTLVELTDRMVSCGTTLYWLPRTGSAEDESGVIAAKLEQAAGASDASDVASPGELRWLDAQLARPAAAMLRAANASRLRTGVPPAARRLVRRLGSIGRMAARRRDEVLLDAVDRALQAVARGHSAGEALLIRDLAAASDDELVARLAALPDRPASAFDVRVEGVVLFRAAGVPLP